MRFYWHTLYCRMGRENSQKVEGPCSQSEKLRGHCPPGSAAYDRKLWPTLAITRIAGGNCERILQ